MDLQTYDSHHPVGMTRQEPGGRLNIKMSSYQYRDSHVKDKTAHCAQRTDMAKDTAELEGQYNKDICHILTSPYDDAYH